MQEEWKVKGQNDVLPTCLTSTRNAQWNLVGHKKIKRGIYFWKARGGGGGERWKVRVAKNFIPCIQTGSVCRGQFGEVLSFYDRPSRLSSNAPACQLGQSRLSGFCCAHRLCVRSPCQHISRMRTIDNNSCVRYQLRAQGRFSSPEPNMLVGTPGEVPASVHTMWLPRKVPPSGTPSEWGDSLEMPFHPSF